MEDKEYISYLEKELENYIGLAKGAEVKVHKLEKRIKEILAWYAKWGCLDSGQAIWAPPGEEFESTLTRSYE